MLVGPKLQEFALRPPGMLKKTTPSSQWIERIEQILVQKI